MSFISKEPVKLVEQTNKGWEVTDEAIRVLSKLNKPIKVLAIAGRYRSGKSHILNKFLAVEAGGFDLGHTVKGCTKGIWMWGKDTGKEITLALDTEGLNDLDNDATFDSKLFSLALLLSSHLVLNLVGVIDEQTIQMLSFVTNLSKIIFTKETDEEEDDGTEYKEIFPPVMFLLRDFVLRPEDGQTLDDYLAEVLKQRPGRSVAIREKNDIRDVITQSFPGCEIMTIPPPPLNFFDSKHEADLSKAFKTSVDDVCSALHKKLMIKCTKHNSGLVEIRDGDSFIALVQACVDGLNTNGKIETAKLFQAVIDVKRKKNVRTGAENEEVSRSLCKDLKASLVEDLRKSCARKAFKTVEEFDAKKKEGVKQLQAKGVGPAVKEVLIEFDNDCVYIRENLSTQLKLEKVEIEAADYKKKYEESQRIIEQLQMSEKNVETNVQFEDVNWLEEHERIRKQFEQGSIDEAEKPKIPEEALKAQNEAFAKKHDEDLRKWHEEHEEMKKKFEQEIAIAKRVKDTRSLDIFGDQWESYSCKRDKKDKESGGGNKIYVRPYTRSNGMKMEGYWRNK